METVVSLFGVQPIRIGGVEMFTRELACQLAEKGWHSVAVFSAAPPPRVKQYFDQAPNLTLEVGPKLETARWDPAVAAILKRYRPKILHLYFVDFVGPYPWLARLHSVKKVFFTDQGSHPEGWVPRRAPLWKRALVRAINLPVAGVFSISEYNRRAMVAMDLLPPQRLHRLYNATHLPQLDSREQQAAAFLRRYSIPEDRDLVLQVSWIIPEKGIADLLETARLVVARRPQTHFAIVGNGDYMEHFQQEAVKMGIADHVTWTGLIDNPMESGVYAAAQVFCLFSRWEEAFGWVIIEAMSFETPVVATSVGAIGELVEDGRTGYLTPRGDTRAAAEKIVRLLDDPDLRARMGQAGHARVKQKFELRLTVAELLRNYELASR